MQTRWGVGDAVTPLGRQGAGPERIIQAALGRGAAPRSALEGSMSVMAIDLQ